MHALKRAIVAALLGFALGGCAQFSPVRYHIGVEVTSDAPVSAATNAPGAVVH